MNGTEQKINFKNALEGKKIPSNVDDLIDFLLENQFDVMTVLFDVKTYMKHDRAASGRQ